MYYDIGYDEAWGFDAYVTPIDNGWQISLPAKFPKHKIPSEMELVEDKKIVIRGTAEQVLLFLKAMDDDRELPPVLVDFYQPLNFG